MGGVSVRLPVFPLNTVLFPGVELPLFVFEDRYRALVHHLLRLPEGPARRFAVVAIREGYEVGDHGVQSVHRVGCSAQPSLIRPNADGTFRLETRGHARFHLDSLDTSGPYLRGQLTWLAEPEGAQCDVAGVRTLAAFERYRRLLSGLRGEDVLADELAAGPVALSYQLAASCPLTLRDRQRLLEAPDAAHRLSALERLIRAELTAMQVVPSLPATEIARMAWHPN